MDGVEGIEPAAGLVNAFRDEVCGGAKTALSKVTEAFLGIWHGAGVKPHVNEVCLTGHLLARGRYKVDIVYVRPVEVYLVIVLEAHVLRIKTLFPEGI